MHITLLRHAPVAIAYRGTYIGWSDVDIAEDFIFPKLLKGREFDVIFSSDLKRCKKTLDGLGMDTYKVDARLREVQFKEHVEGKQFDMLQVPPPALLDMQHWMHYICEESVKDFSTRVKAFLDTIYGENVLICTHGGTMRMIESIVKERDFFELYSEKRDYLHIEEMRMMRW